MRKLFSILTVLAIFGWTHAALPAHAATGSAGYFEIERDGRFCATPFCGGWFVERPHRKLTRCADGTKQKRCYVAEIDWDALGLSPEQTAALSAISASRVLVRGRIHSHEEHGDLGTLIPRMVWLAATDGAPHGRFYRVENTGIVCVTTPCPSVEGRRLNTPRTDTFDRFGLHGVGAKREHHRGAARAAEIGALVVAGRLVRRPREVLLRATQFYLPIGIGDCSVGCDECEPINPSCGPTNCRPSCAPPD